MAEEGFKRKLTAILSADVKGYSHLMEYSGLELPPLVISLTRVLFENLQIHFKCEDLGH